MQETFRCLNLFSHFCTKINKQLGPIYLQTTLLKPHLKTHFVFSLSEVSKNVVHRKPT